MHALSKKAVIRSLLSVAHRVEQGLRQESLTTTCLLAVYLHLLLLPFASTVHGAVSEFTGTGEIIVVSPLSSTIAVEIVSDDRPHIVGGKLAVDAILLRNGRKSDLQDFHIGEIVKMSWRILDQKKEIISILAERAAPASPPAPARDIKGKTPPAIAAVPPLPASPQTLSPATRMIGQRQYHTVGGKDTLLDIARRYNLGFNEIIAMYPDDDPWLPPIGKKLLLPTERLLPEGSRTGIVINIPELRLYHFSGAGEKARVTTYPVGIGDTDFQTEPGKYSVGNKAIDPTWYIPPSLRAKYGVASVPPGTDNPLGRYWLGLKGTMYGIHGTDIPWSIGRTVTHGCIRMYPEDISGFFSTIQVGTPVEIVYEPVKIAQIGEDIYMEVHHDVYGRIPSLAAYARQMIVERGLWMDVDRERFMAAIEGGRGIPENITITAPLTLNYRQ